MDLRQYTWPLGLLLGQLAGSSVRPTEATAPRASAHSSLLIPHAALYSLLSQLQQSPRRY